MKGRVFLVGAGPGAPGLITLRGAQCLAQADVVLYDALANPQLLSLAPEGAERCLVGKRHGRTTVAQDEIERLLVEHARAGRTVVRLKGGDPFIFGRGGEEAEACRSAGIDFEVVPGVTAAVAAPAYAGIPLTHRDHASTVTFVTGRPGMGRDELAYDWEALARVGGTLVFLMAALRAREICVHLVDAGMDPATPAAAIRWASTARQRTLLSNLEELGDRLEQEDFRPPVVIVVGAVAQLAERIAWYESLPLFGRRIVVTRARHQAEELARRLESSGAEVVAYPTIEIVDAGDSSVVAAIRAADYDWIVLTSSNGAERFFDKFLAGGRDIRELAGLHFAAIGPGTRAAVERFGIRVAAQPAEYRAEALVDALGDVAGLRVLIARAERARETLPQELEERGAHVEVVALYRTVLPARPEPLERLADVDMITFTSASTVENFARLANAQANALLRRCAIAAIGPITASALERIGVAADVVPSNYTIDALAAAIVEFFANRKPVK